MLKLARIIFISVLTLVLAVLFVLPSVRPLTAPAPARAEPTSQKLCPVQGSGFLPSTPLQNYQISSDLQIQWGHPAQAFEEIGQRNYSFIVNQPYTYKLTPGNIDAIKSISPETKILRYRSGVEVFNSTIHDDTKWGDDFMRRQNTEEEWLDVWTNHQDWLTRDANGNYVTRSDASNPETISGKNAYLLDISNGEVKEWLFQVISRVVRENGFDGAFIDLLYPTFLTHTFIARPVINGEAVSDEQWREMILSLMQYINTRRNETPAFKNKLFIFNGLGNGNISENNDGLNFLSSSQLDGAQIESFLRWSEDPPDYYRSEDEWQKDVDLLRDVTTLEPGKHILVRTRNGNLYSGDLQENAAAHQKYAHYAYASLLLGYNSNNVSFLYPGKGFPQLGQHWLPYIKPHTIDLGEPIGQYGYDSVSSVYYREFENGEVFVNPKETPTSILAENDYLNLLTNEVYHEADMIKMPPHTAAILIYGEKCLSGDANKDKRVDSEDFALLVEDYLGEPVHNTDFNSDGWVDSEDFAILQANYLK